MTDLKPGRYLDALIAEKVMGIPTEYGYQKFFATPLFIGNYLDEGFSITPFEGVPLLDKRPSHDFFKGYFQIKSCNPLPNRYSTDILAAWEVMDKIKHFGVEVGYSSRRGVWFCTNVAEDFRYGFDLSQKQYDELLNDGCFVLIGESFPHVICLAALKAVGQ